MRFRLAAPLALVVIAGLAAGGCVQRNVERIDAEEAASLPPPPPPQASSRQSGSTEAVATRITGTVRVADELADAVPANATLYLIVRVAGRDTGAPLAVKQVRAPAFPYEFDISERDAMIEGTPLIGEMSVTARLDQDGNAFSTTAGDLSGSVSPVVAGDSGVTVVLDQVAQGDTGR